MHALSVGDGGDGPGPGPRVAGAMFGLSPRPTMRATAMTRLTDMLARAGCVAADEEAAELLAAAGGERSKLISLVHRRLRGEPLAWVTGQAAFGDLSIAIEPGIYVPRWQSLELAAPRSPVYPRPVRRSTCVRGPAPSPLRSWRAGPRRRSSAPIATPGRSRVPGPTASTPCGATSSTRSPPTSRARRTSSWPSCPTFLSGAPSPPPRRAHVRGGPHYHGGPDGTDILRRAIEGAPKFLRPGGALLLELGGEQADLVGPQMEEAGYVDVHTWADEDGDVRGVEASWLLPGLPA